MNEDLKEKADQAYEAHEANAAAYFNQLSTQLKSKSYADQLAKDFSIWQKEHVKQVSLTSFFTKERGNIDEHNYRSYLKLLKISGKLDSYLNRSVSYIYMRDLGKSLADENTQAEISKTVQQLEKQLVNSNATKAAPDLFTLPSLYRLAQKEDIELTVIWLIDKLKLVGDHIPTGMNAVEAKRKLIKIIAGVVLHQLDDFTEETTAGERSEKLAKAIRLGYAYGLTYPFIDDLLDADVLSPKEKEEYTAFIRTTLLTGEVPQLENWPGESRALVQFIHGELKAAFQYIKDNQNKTTSDTFFEQAYVFFQSQEIDRNKDLSNPHYTNEELFLPIILKSAASRLIVRSVLGAQEDEGFGERTFYYGIYNQLADDFTDMFDDLEAGAVTPYTYYFKYHQERPDLINPFELYWTVVANVIHQVYTDDAQAREVILSRAINSQQRFKKKVGEKKYQEMLVLFSFDKGEWGAQFQQAVQKAEHVDFFDKLIRDQIITNNRRSEAEKEAFKKSVKEVRGKINAVLQIEPDENKLTEDTIVKAANFSLQSGGKRLRPLMTWFIGTKEFGLTHEAIEPLLKSLEYMHTASLIFDDLPAQDNSPIRRGHPTVHEVYNTAIAELTGLYLTQMAVVEQTRLETFDSKTVLRLIQYSATIVTEISKGQAMDLHSEGKQLTLEELNEICFYKTGIAFEAALVMPAILANKEDTTIESLKKFAYHAGIAFQIKDDLLDTEGNETTLGKPGKKDTTNNRSTFVTILGLDEATKQMWNHYCLAAETLLQAGFQTKALQYFLDYIINRTN